MTNPATGDHETAPMITLVWGQALAPMVSAMILQRPALAQRLMLAPRRVVHSLAAFIHRAREAGDSVEGTVEAVEQRDIRVLLAHAILDPHPRLYRTLDRLGPRVESLAFYRCLNVCLSGPAADLLREDDNITSLRLEILNQIVADPVLLAARKAIGWSMTNIEMLKNVLAFLRMTGLANDIEALPMGSGWRAINRRVSSDLGRACAPALPFEVPTGWRQVATVAELWEIGSILKNCVSGMGAGGEDYVDGLVSGHAALLVHDEKPVTLACLRCVGRNLWIIAEVSGLWIGSDGVLLRDALTDQLRVSIAAAGGQLLDQPPLSSIRHLARRLAHVSEDCDVEELEGAA